MAERDGMAERQTRRESRLVPSGPAQARVWVLDDARGGGSGQALGIAERLGVPFRRVPVAWSWMAALAGFGQGGFLPHRAGVAARWAQALPTGAIGAAAPPLLVLSGSRRSAAVALWLKSRLGSRIVHCATPGLLGMWGAGVAHRGDYDLLVAGEHDRPAVGSNVLTVLGTPHRVGPHALSQAATQWGERLDHLPHPRVALLVGGPVRGTDMEPARAHGLGRAVARLVGGLGGSVLATTSRRTGREASDALAAGLGQVMHLLYRWGEPGENPYLGYLALADAVIVTADSVSMLSEACATAGPVYAALPELARGRSARLAVRLAETGQVRPLRADLSPWPRTPLDEAGRVAGEIRRRFAID